MTVRLARMRTAAMALVLTAMSCSSGSGEDLLDAEAAAPLLTAFEDEAGRMFSVASTTGAAPDQEPDLEVPERLGAIGQQIVDVVKPEEATAALSALEEATTARLAKAGGRRAGKRAVVIRDITVRLAPDAPSKLASQLEDADTPPEARETLRSWIEAAVHQLVFASLLADPPTQARLAPRLSPNDFPTTIPTDPDGEVDPLLGGFESIDQWRDEFFDDGKLTVPQPNDDGLGWDVFRAWARYVNPDLASTARQIFEAFQGHFLSGRHRHPIVLE